VNEETEITFEYKMKSVKKLMLMLDIDMSKINKFPFQTQITYTALDGSRCIRVITDVMEGSTDRQELEAQADFYLLGQAAVQKSAQMARGGHVEKAQIHAKAWH